MAAVTAAVAQGAPNFTISPSGGSNRPMPRDTAGNIVVSIRNVSGVQKTFTLVKTSSPGCMGLTTRQIDDSLPADGATLANDNQKQFVIMTPPAGYPADAVHTCTFNVTVQGDAPESFSVAFHVNAASAAMFDPQPSSLVIGTMSKLSELQSLLLTNYTTQQTTLTAVIQGSGLTFTDPSCATPQSCDVTMPSTQNPPAHVAVPVRCAGTGGISLGTITYYVASAEVGSHSYSCTSKGGAVGDPTLDIAESSLDLRGPAMSTQVATAMVTGTDNMFVSAMIVGADASHFAFTGATCPAGQTCMPVMPLSLPQMIDVTCGPTSTRRNATLVVNGELGSQDTAVLSCALDTPSLQVMPAVIDVGDVAVNDMDTGSVFLENSGSMQLTGVVITTGDPAWTTTACTNAMPCSIDENTTLQIPVTFRPVVHGRNDPVMMVASSNGGTGTTQLRGRGVGSRLRVLSPPGAPWLVDLGTLSLDELRAKPVKLYADGNLDLDVGIGALTAPFSTSAATVMVQAMTENTFDVRCQSPTALPQTDRTLMLAPGPGSYMNDTTQLMVRCKVSNTRVRVMPSELDFGEVQRGTATRSIQVTITNPGAPVNLMFVRLSSMVPALQLAAPATPTVLGTGATLPATISLLTANEVTLEDVALEVGVEGADPLVTPIAGKVVTASARVTPMRLDLGTVCVGTPVDGQVTMINDGTATLRVQPPEMMAPFAPLFVDPMVYPTDGSGVPLFAGKTATAGVMTGNGTAGKVESTLTWDVNVAAAPFAVPVNVEFIDDGTGVSPQRIVFDPMPANETSPQRVITLENCEERAVVVDVRGVVASKGSAEAWTLTPGGGMQDLEPHKTTRIVARFTPKKPGHYEAKVFVRVDGIDYFVDLVGDALGNATERESLYGCDCNTGGSPLGLLGVLAVLLAISGRRRT